MRIGRALLPYLLAAVVIAAGSVALVLTTVTPDAGVAATASGRSAPELALTGRLAYWRQNPAGAFVLSAANFDGTAARPVVTLPPNSSRPFGTRWTGDGKGIAYVSDVGVTLVRLDGTRTDFPLPAATRDAGFRIIDMRWSPSGTKVAATAFRSTDGKSEIYIATSERRAFARPADLGAAFAADWLSDEEVLYESASGSFGAISESGAARKLFDQPAASPFIERGRVYFLAGAVSSSGDASGIFVANPTIWSVAVSGSDSPRRESRIGVGGPMRLDGRWPDGRWLVHVFRDSTQWIAGSESGTLTTLPVRRAVVSSDGRLAIGFAGARLVRIDLTRGLAPDSRAFVVLLDGIVGADAWVPRTSAAAKRPEPSRESAA